VVAFVPSKTPTNEFFSARPLLLQALCCRQGLRAATENGAVFWKTR